MFKSLKSFKRVLVHAAGGALLLSLGATAFAQQKVRIAFGDVLSTETLSMVVALERAKAKGVDYVFLELSPRLLIDC